MMRYCPVSSVTAVRTFSMSAGLAASTVTPGSTPPDASRTVPVRDAWAKTLAGRISTATTVRHFRTDRIQGDSFLFRELSGSGARPRGPASLGRVPARQIQGFACSISEAYAPSKQRVKEFQVSVIGMTIFTLRLHAAERYCSTLLPVSAGTPWRRSLAGVVTHVERV